MTGDTIKKWQNKTNFVINNFDYYHKNCYFSHKITIFPTHTAN